MEFLPTGNPFVDTGMYAMQARASELHHNEEIDVLTSELLKEVLGDGRWIAQTNRRLNSFFMVFMNSLLVNPSSNRDALKKGSGKRGFLSESDKGWQIYVSTLIRLRDELLLQPSDAVKNCESCGDRPASRVVDAIGRDYFPLAGSPGNDAQALPSASRSPRLCAFCLLAVHWLPVGAVVYSDGKRSFLACFQFTDASLSQEVTENIYRENSRRLSSKSINEQVAVSGSSEGKTPSAKILIHQMQQLQLRRKRENLSSDVTLNIWKFNNFGDKPDSDLVEILNPALQFLWEAARVHYSEVMELLKHEDSKKPGTHLLTAIEQQRDYSSFYPQKGHKGAGAGAGKLVSTDLYELYQTRIMRRMPAALRVARRLAQVVYARLKDGDKKAGKFLEKLLKENPRWTKDKEIRPKLRGVLVDLAERGELTLDEYAQLFPAQNLEGVIDVTEARELWRMRGQAVRPSADGWTPFWFYLHHVATKQEESFSGVNESQNATSTDANGDLAMFTNPKIQTFAQDVFDLYLEHKGGDDKARGVAYIKKYILDGFAHRKITTEHLRRWFYKLAETREDYRLEDWDALCRDEQGRDATGELRFQLRLELTNLYRQAMQSLTEAN
ncbi:MAG: CRISPR-associated protein Cst1 [Acidobacteriota bacterium]|jgi:hypothetical protein|nr:CRISPR-associated protein Cst1 [Acidobacteriota bacterium]